LVVAGIALVMLLGAFASRSGKKAIEVQESVVRTGSFSTKLPETGVVQLPRTLTIPAAVAGNLGTIAVQGGTRVVQGQLLATIANEQVSSNVRDAEDTALSAHGKAQSVAESNAVLPQQNRSAVVQAQAAVVAARSQLTQAQQDVVAGSQSGLGYGGTTAEEQRLAAQTVLAKSATDLREAKRIFEANKYLYEQGGISHDALQQSEARYEEAQASFDQAHSERRITEDQLNRETQVLRDRVRSAQDGLRQAEAALASAQANASESKLGDLAAARGDAERAEADLTYARDQAGRLEIRAPIGGIIESVASQPNDSLRPVQPGDAVTVGQQLFTLAADENYVVRTKVDEQDVSGIKLGQRAIVSGEDFGTAKLDGHVIAISPVAQKSDDPSNTSRQVVTTIQLDRRLPFLRDGMTVDVDIVTHDEKRVLSVPTGAVRKDDGGNYVFVDKNGSAQRTPVRLGAQNDTQTIVTSGLHDGDRVVNDKSPEVAAGSSLKPAPTPSPGASALAAP
jgi:RND family efflux transporter MFP subunit